jgi:hypothetical protein
LFRSLKRTAKDKSPNLQAAIIGALSFAVGFNHCSVRSSERQRINLHTCRLPSSGPYPLPSVSTIVPFAQANGKGKSPNLQAAIIGALSFAVGFNRRIAKTNGCHKYLYTITNI